MLNAGIAVIVIPFIVNFLKKWVNTRFAPVVAFILGVIFGIGDWIVAGKQGDLVTAILTGIAVGGTSTGLYDLTKTTIRGK